MRLNVLKCRTSHLEQVNHKIIIQFTHFAIAIIIISFVSYINTNTYAIIESSQFNFIKKNVYTVYASSVTITTSLNHAMKKKPVELFFMNFCVTHYLNINIKYLQAT